MRYAAYSFRQMVAQTLKRSECCKQYARLLRNDRSRAQRKPSQNETQRHAHEYAKSQLKKYLCISEVRKRKIQIKMKSCPNDTDEEYSAI